MTWRSLLLLVLVLGLLAGAWLYLEHDEARGVRALDRAVVEGVHEADVVGVRLENVQRDYIAEFRRTADGAGWSMITPYATAAEGQLVARLVSVPLERRGRIVDNPDLAALSLSPPRQEVRLRLADGSERRVRVGAVDLDGQRVYVQAGEDVLLVVRDIETLADRVLDEWISRNLTDVDARQVVQVRRSGTLVRAEEQLDLQLAAASDGGVWRLSAPWQVRADPAAIVLLAQLGAGLRLESFLDMGTRTRAALGLDPAAFTLTTTTLQDASATLSFGRAPNGRMVVGSDQRSFVGLVEDAVLELATTPALEFVDHQLHRFPRAEIDLVRWERAGTRVELRRTHLGWTVAEGRAGDGFAALPRLAEARSVESLLAKLDTLQASSFRPGLELGAPTGEGLWVGARGALVGGRFGADYSEPGTVSLARFLRAEEDLVALVPPEWRAVLQTDPATLESLDILLVDEVTLTGLRLATEAKERSYVRGARSVWSLRGTTVEAVELRPVLDLLLFLRAARHVSDAAPLREPIRVSYEAANDRQENLTIGLCDFEGRTHTAVDYAGRRSLARDAQLHAKLSAVLQN